MSALGKIARGETLEPKSDFEFLRLKFPTVFLASPGDVKGLRADIDQAFRERMASRANPEKLDLYLWEEAFSLTSVDHQKPVEAQIPLASDPNCKAVLCLFGERIGKPLTAWEKYEGFFGKWQNSRKGRLVMPWEPGAEKSGGFALTEPSLKFWSRCMQAVSRIHDRRNTTLPHPLFWG